MSNSRNPARSSGKSRAAAATPWYPTRIRSRPSSPRKIFVSARPCPIRRTPWTGRACGSPRWCSELPSPERWRLSTIGWTEIVAHHVSADPSVADFGTFADRNPALLDKRLLARHYTPAVLASPAARAGWVSPDRAAFPWIEGPCTKPASKRRPAGYSRPASGGRPGTAGQPARANRAAEPAGTGNTSRRAGS